MKKKDIAYLKKNFDLKKFLKLISKSSGIDQSFEIFKNLYYDRFSISLFKR